MKRTLHFLYTSFLGIILFSCSNPSADHSFKITGNIKDFADTSVILEEYRINEVVYIASAEVNNKGEFHIEADLNPESMYSLRIGKVSIPFVADKANLKVNGTYPLFTDLEISGSPTTGTLLEFIKEMDKLTEEIADYRMMYDSLTLHGAQDSVLDKIIGMHDERVVHIKTYIKKFADTTANPQVAIYAIRNLDPIRDMEYFENFASKLSERFKGNPFVDSFISMVGNNIAQIKKTGPQVGDVAPSFTLLDMKNREVSLESTRGKYILLDFWASWCPPCREENPNIQKAYASFADKNFTVVSVSIDKNKDKWLSAIKDDRMSWINLNDAKEWDSPLLNLYGFDRIPTNYLIDPSGKIIAKNLFGQELISKLSEVLAVENTASVDVEAAMQK